MGYQDFSKKEIKVSSLVLDLENPRLPEVQGSQRDATRTLFRLHKEHIMNLAKDLAENNTNPARRLIVTPDGNEKYVVIDGNRRTCCFKILETPSLVEDLSTDKEYKALKKLSENYIKSPIEYVDAVIFQNREDTDTWIVNIHDGERQGVGEVNWSAQQKQRFKSRRKGTKNFELQILDFVGKHGKLSDLTKEKIENGEYPITNLKRLLGTETVRNNLGILKEKNPSLSNQSSPYTYFPIKEIIPALEKVVDDIGNGKLKVNKIKSVEQRKNYIREDFNQSLLPNPEKRGDTLTLLDKSSIAIATDKDNPSESKRNRRKQQSNKRAHLIPYDFTLSIDSKRINDIYIELKDKLYISEHPNACAVLLRVFIELSVDHYLKYHDDLQWEPFDKLKTKGQLITSHLVKIGKLHKHEIKPINRSFSNDDDLNSLSNLHAYVHHMDIMPIRDQLISDWQRFKPLIEIIWTRDE